MADIFDKYDLRGKLTIIPMPSCLGRLDESLKRVPAEHLQDFLQVVRERIQPRFDITPEFLTHPRAYDLKKGQYQHIFEDAWITGAPPEGIVEYLVLAFSILKNVGLESPGIMSPWVSGIDVEKKYVKALADAHWRVFNHRVDEHDRDRAAQRQRGENSEGGSMTRRRTTDESCRRRFFHTFGEVPHGVTL